MVKLTVGAGLLLGLVSGTTPTPGFDTISGKPAITPGYDMPGLDPWPFVPSEVNMFNQPTNKYHMISGLPVEEVRPSLCGNNATIIDNIHLVHSAALLGMCPGIIAGTQGILNGMVNGTMAKMGMDYTNPGHKAVWDAELAKVDLSKWNCGLSQKCLDDPTCCKYIKAWPLVSNVALATNLGIKASPVWVNAVLERQVSGFTSFFRFGEIKKETHFYGPVQGSLGYAVTELFAPNVSSVPHLAPVYEVIKAKALAKVPQPAGVPVTGSYPPGLTAAQIAQFDAINAQVAAGRIQARDTLDMLALGSMAKFAASNQMLGLGLKPYKFHIKSPWTNPFEDQGAEYSREGVLTAQPKNTLFRFNRCIDLDPYNLLTNYTGPNWPSCTDGGGFVFRGRNLTATPESIARNSNLGLDRINEIGEEWSLGNDQGNIFNKTEIYLMLSGSLGIGNTGRNAQWISGSAMELALQVVNDPRQTAFPNLKDYHVGLVFMDEAAAREHLAPGAFQRTMRRIPQRTVAVVGETESGVCFGTAPLIHEANMMQVAARCSDEAFTNKVRYPNMAMTQVPVSTDAAATYRLLVDMNWSRIAMVTDPRSTVLKGGLAIKQMMDIAKAKFLADPTDPEGWNWDLYMKSNDNLSTASNGLRYISDAQHNKILSDLKAKDYRIILWAGEGLAFLDFMCQAFQLKFYGRQAYVLFGVALTATFVASHGAQRRPTYGPSPCGSSQMYYILEKAVVLGIGGAGWSTNKVDNHPYIPWKKMDDLREDYQSRHPECQGGNYDLMVVGLGRWENCWGMTAPSAFDATMATLKALDLAIGQKNFTEADFLNEPVTGKLLNPEVAKTMSQIMASGQVNHQGVTGMVGYDKNLKRRWGLELFQFGPDTGKAALQALRPPLSMVYFMDTERFPRGVNKELDEFAFENVTPIKWFNASKTFTLGLAWNATGQWRPSDKIPDCKWGEQNVPIYGTDQESCQPCEEGSGPSAFGYSQAQVRMDAVKTCEPCALGFYSNKVDTINPLTGVMECKKSPPGAIVLKTGQKNYQECPAGYFSMESGSLVCLPCQVGTYSPVAFSSRCLSCPRGEWNDQSGQSECKKCPVGEGTASQGSTSELDCMCPSGSFAACLPGDGAWPATLAELENHCGSEKPAPCKKCPKGAQCDGYGMYVGPDMKIKQGKNVMCNIGKDAPSPDHKCIHSPPIPKVGYWVAKTAIYNNYDCFYAPRCPGLEFEACGTNFEGFSCAVCPNDFLIKNSAENEVKAECLPCTDSSASYIMAPFLVIVGGLGTYAVYLASVKNRQAMGRMAVAATMGLMVQTLQYLTVFDRFSIKWGSPMGEILQALQFLAFDLNVVGGGCVFGNGAIGTTIIRFMLPAYLGTMMFISSKISTYGVFGRFSVSPWKPDSFFNGLGLIWLVFFISLCMMILSQVQCYEHPKPMGASGGDPKQSLRTAPEVICWEGDHLVLVAISLIGLSVYILTPSAIIYNITQRAQKDPKTHLNIVRHYFLIARYGVINMHWTYYVLFRNLTLAFIPVIFNSKASEQLIVFSSYTLAWCIFVGACRPWLSPALNVLDTVILGFVSLMSAWGFVYVWEVEGSAAQKSVRSGMLVIGALCFLLIFMTLGCFIVSEFFGCYHDKLIEIGLQAPPGANAEQIEKKKNERLSNKAKNDAIIELKTKDGTIARVSVKELEKNTKRSNNGRIKPRGTFDGIGGNEGLAAVMKEEKPKILVMPKGTFDGLSDIGPEDEEVNKVEMGREESKEPVVIPGTGTAPGTTAALVAEDDNELIVNVIPPPQIQEGQGDESSV